MESNAPIKIRSQIIQNGEHRFDLVEQTMGTESIGAPYRAVRGEGYKWFLFDGNGRECAIAPNKKQLKPMAIEHYLTGKIETPDLTKKKGKGEVMRAKVLDLYLSVKSQAEVARQLGVSRQRVNSLLLKNPDYLRMKREQESNG